MEMAGRTREKVARFTWASAKALTEKWVHTTPGIQDTQKVRVCRMV